jgi:hypothetical protein
MSRCLSFCVLTLALLQTATAQSVSVQNGNICIADQTGELKPLTTSGLDSQPVLSPDRRWIVFVRGTPDKTIPTGAAESRATELWQIGADGKNATLLVHPKQSEKMETILADFSKLQFSGDGRYVFFLSAAWATSGAVHVVDTKTRKEHFVCPGNDLEVIQAGKYRNCLLVQQHRYFLGTGSFDWYWLLRSNGQEIGPVGEDTESFKKSYVTE